MSYITDLARQIRKEIASDLLPSGDLDLLFELYALLALAKGTAVDEQDVHNAWVVWMDHSGRRHRAVKPFDELGVATQQQDSPFVNAIRSVANRHSKRDLRDAQ